MKKFVVMVAMVAMAVLSTGCGAIEDFIGDKELSQEEIERTVITDWYTEVTGDDGEGLSNTDMERMINKKSLEEEIPGYWEYEHEYDRVQTYHAYGKNGRMWFAIDLDTRDILEYGREE